MQRTRWKIMTVVGFLLAAGIGVTVTVHGGPARSAPAVATPQDVLEHCGVVDLDLLVRKHPDAQRLDDLDRQISYLEAEQETSPSEDEATKRGFQELTRLQDQLSAQFKAEMNATRGRLDSQKADVEKQLKDLADQLKSEVDAYQKSLKGRLEKEMGGTSQAPRTQAKAREMLGDYALARERLLSGKRLEGQRQVEEHLAAKKRELEANLAQQMDKILKSHQAEKLQIQLDSNTATTEEERKKLQDRLSQLNQQEEDARARLRDQMGAAYSAERQQELAQTDADYKAYEKKVDSDIHRQLGRLGGSSGEAVTPVQITRFKHMMEAKQAEVKARFESRKQTLMSDLRQESDAAQASLEAKKKEIMARLERERKRILKGIEQKDAQLSQDEKKRRAHVEDELSQLKTQRERVYDGIVDQIRGDVASVAREKNVPVVLGGCRVNVSCQDLTQMALDRVAHK